MSVSVCVDYWITQAITTLTLKRGTSLCGRDGWCGGCYLNAHNPKPGIDLLTSPFSRFFFSSSFFSQGRSPPLPPPPVSFRSSESIERLLVLTKQRDEDL